MGLPPSDWREQGLEEKKKERQLGGMEGTDNLTHKLQTTPLTIHAPVVIAAPGRPSLSCAAVLLAVVNSKVSPSEA